MVMDLFYFDFYGKHYMATGTVVPLLRSLNKRIGELLSDIKSSEPGFVNRVLLYDSLTAEFSRYVREGITAGLIVEDVPDEKWDNIYENKTMIVKRKVA